MRESQNSVQNELAAIIVFSQRENLASQQFEHPSVGADNRMHSRDERFKESGAPQRHARPALRKGAWLPISAASVTTMTYLLPLTTSILPVVSTR